MDCYPPCVTCSGRCKQPQAPVEATDTRRVAVSTGGSRPGYIHMFCGHYTTPEEQVLLGTKAPKGKTAWCNKCGKWRKLAPKEKPEPSKDVLF